MTAATSAGTMAAGRLLYANARHRVRITAVAATSAMTAAAIAEIGTEQGRRQHIHREGGGDRQAPALPCDEDAGTDRPHAENRAQRVHPIGRAQRDSHHAHGEARHQGQRGQHLSRTRPCNITRAGAEHSWKVA